MFHAVRSRLDRARAYLQPLRKSLHILLIFRVIRIFQEQLTMCGRELLHTLSQALQPPLHFIMVDHLRLGVPGMRMMGRRQIFHADGCRLFAKLLYHIVRDAPNKCL